MSQDLDAPMSDTTAPEPHTAGAARPRLLGREGWHRLFGPYREARTYREAAFLLTSLMVGTALFTLIVTGVSLGVGALISLIGVPVLVLTGILVRVASNLERARARALLGIDDLPDAHWPGEGETWWHRIWTCAKDAAVWKEALYGVVLLAVGIVTFTVVIGVAAAAIGLVLLPAWVSALPGDGAPDGAWDIAGYVVVGIAAWLAFPWVVRALAAGSRALVVALLGPGTSELTARVDHLTESRARSVDAATAERQRIERALHDGAQMRLTSLAMELGRAKERMQDDPEGAAALLEGAHDEAKRALVELRDLARGIHPAVLTDRGLRAAVGALAARSTVPVDVSIDLPTRPSAAVEATAYYVVAEGLTNVTRPAGASRASVRVRRRGDALVVEVEDDGRGGARVAEPGGLVPSGLRGLADRVAGVDGDLEVSSPPGGPTVLRAEVPCAS
jgi:signal transduction histidine kinase